MLCNYCYLLFIQYRVSRFYCNRPSETTDKIFGNNAREATGDKDLEDEGSYIWNSSGNEGKFRLCLGAGNSCKPPPPPNSHLQHGVGGGGGGGGGGGDDTCIMWHQTNPPPANASQHRPNNYLSFSFSPLWVRPVEGWQLYLLKLSLAGWTHEVMKYSITEGENSWE
jgi:hypothetical protein